MTILMILMVTAAFIQGVLPLLLTGQLSSRVRRKLKEDFPAEFAPPLTIILPCKGIDFGFEENVVSILNQDYPSFEIIFATADDHDPAYGILKRLMEEYKSARATLITAGTSNKRSQKLNNQLAALKKISPFSEVLVFLDSDVRAEKDFLRNLIRPLQDKTIGVSTGYRWYLPVHGRLGAMVRSTWNAGALPLLMNPRYNFAFGGTMAIRREVFEEAGVAKVWEGALTDDFPLSLAVKKRGYHVRFVPQCLSVSLDDASFKEALEWTNRQQIIARVYHPRFWRMVTITYVGNFGLLVTGAILGMTGTPAGWFLIMSILSFQMINGIWIFSLVKKMLPGYTSTLTALQGRYYLSIPLALGLIFVNTMVSISRRTICWRGVKYRLVSPSETIVEEA